MKIHDNDTDRSSADRQQISCPAPRPKHKKAGRPSSDHTVSRQSILNAGRRLPTSRQSKALAQQFDSLQRFQGNRYVQRLVNLRRHSKKDAEVTSELEAAIQSKRGSGQHLESRVRNQMESSFGTDFSGVRVHSDADADNMNRHMNARAFTTGQDVFFRQGAYDPGNSVGRELIAHELTHVVQQNDELQRKMAVGAPGDIYEQEADETARNIIRRESCTDCRKVDRKEALQMQEEEEESLQMQEEEEEMLQMQAEEEEEMQMRPE